MFYFVLFPVGKARNNGISHFALVDELILAPNARLRHALCGLVSC